MNSNSYILLNFGTTKLIERTPPPRGGFVFTVFLDQEPWRVPGLPIRDCARGCNNCVHMRAQMSATDVTKKILFERLYLVSEMGTFGP